MAKKKGSSAADDLIKSLIDDVNEDDSSSSEGHEFADFDTVAPTSSVQFPVGLDSGKNSKAQDNRDMNASSSEEAIPPFPMSHSKKNIKNIETKVIQDDKTIPLKLAPTPMYKPEPVAGLGSSLSTHMDASLLQAENLRIAQSRILQLEEEVDRLRRDHEEVSSAADAVKTRGDEMLIRIQSLERERDEVRENSETELMILKGQLGFKEKELNQALQKIDDLDVRLKNDFRKIRVRERELENRLELVRAEKSTLVRAKDDSILDLKRRVDQLQHEIENYREKCLELNKTLESQKEQFKRTARALKMALTNLEVKDEDVIPLKKAE